MLSSRSAEMKKFAKGILLVCLCVAGQLAEAQGLSVAYLDGAAGIRSGSTWNPLSVGDTVPIDATIRLEPAGYVQLRGAGIDIILTRPGIYSVKEIVERRKTVSTRGIGAAIVASLRALASGSSAPQNTASGARAGNAGDAEEDELWVESSAGAFLAAGKTDVKAGRYDDALKELRQAEASASSEEIPEIRFYLASTYSLKGDLGPAWKLAERLAPVPGTDWAGDLVLLKARLLIDTSAYAEAAALLVREGGWLAQDSSRAPLYQFLLGVGYRGAGAVQSSRQALSRVVAISPDSDLGIAAADLLKIP
jgi:tetratricopeptide (TPR) repeat protein